MVVRVVLLLCRIRVSLVSTILSLISGQPFRPPEDLKDVATVSSDVLTMPRYIIFVLWEAAHGIAFSGRRTPVRFGVTPVD